MTLHLIKLAVGVETVRHLGELQKARLAAQRAQGEKARLRHLTRMTPKRVEEIAAGSLYWVIRGVIQVRQRILGLAAATNDRGEPRCAILLDRKLVRVRPRGHRPFQGWRYLKAEDAPPDAGRFDPEEAPMPAEMVAKLRDLGLL